MQNQAQIFCKMRLAPEIDVLCGDHVAPCIISLLQCEPVLALALEL